MGGRPMDLALRQSAEHLLWEQQHLASYAEKGSATRGRAHAEQEHAFRTPFERDRDRIVHSRSFRRLEAKTQVFIRHPGHPYRTRLTHTLEVAQISRTVAHTLRLNEDLTEAIALAHDLGHPPFGHAGERVLDELAADVGGFDHNRQSLRTVDLLETRYSAFPGLNLTWEVREGLGKHGSGRASMPGAFGSQPMPSLEAQVVDVCDEIAYVHHDLDDGLASGLITLDQVLEELPEWRAAWELSCQGQPDAPRTVHVGETVRRLIDVSTTDLILASHARLRRYHIVRPDDARDRTSALAALSRSVSVGHARQKRFLFRALYRHPEVERSNAAATDAMRALFHRFDQGIIPLSTPLSAQEAAAPRARRVIDEVARMTDEQVFQRLQE